MSESGSRRFTSFLKSSAGMLSSKKDVKFLPPQTQIGKDGETSEARAKSQKEHRRAQVRKAQIEHRQRKENYIKHLEQDVIRLRDQISSAETEALAIKQENDSIKTALASSNVPSNTIASSNLQVPHLGASPSDFTTFSSPQGMAAIDFSQELDWLSTSSPSNVSMIFDDVIDNSCLQVSAPGSFDNATSLDSPDIFNFPAHAVSQLIQQKAPDTGQGHEKPLPQLPGQSATTTNTNLPPDLSTLAINFILALEHPCRTHFHTLPTEFDPTGDPTGHELMASTFLYAHAPPSTFEHIDSACWTAPSLELTQLWQMSQSLPKGDFEITPVQAWFLLSQNYDVGSVLKKLDTLKGGIATLVGCFAFGAVMDELKFWDVVKSVMSE